MKEVEVGQSEHGYVEIRAFLTEEELHERGATVRLSPEQVPLVISWILEAAGLSGAALSGRKVEAFREQAALMERIGRIADIEHENSDVRAAHAAILAVLKWAAGETDVTPDEWLAGFVGE